MLRPIPCVGAARQEMPAAMSRSAKLRELLDATRVYAVTDVALDEKRLLAVTRSLLEAGIRIVQYRDKERPDGSRVQLAGQLVELVHAYDGLLLVNDRADVAVAAGADGAHLGQDDLPLDAARSLLGPDLILGASASYLEEIAPACAAGIDYLGFGAVYPTETKPDAEFAGLELFREACGASRVPVVGIGGITAERASSVIAAGAAGIAVVSALYRAPDPGAAA
ncbi:MAG: thiamine-phosphate pyrophosphorylase, partial [Chloroflexota bacterium]|nr:thiamine-phosphate pyrophosphorylase [Chloroflexota bacterium]